MPRRYLNAVRGIFLGRHPAGRPWPCTLEPGHLAVLLLLAALFTPPSARAQDVGHKPLGGVGIDAGVQAAPGLYLSDRLIRYDADRLRDRNGDLVPIRGLRVDVVANAFGASLTLKPRNAPYLSFAFGLPLADVSVNASDPRIAVDRSRFADIFVQPLKLGSRFPRGDVVTSYAFYAPTGRFEPHGREGVGRGFWSHQFSLGGAVFEALIRLDILDPDHGIRLVRLLPTPVRLMELVRALPEMLEAMISGPGRLRFIVQPLVAIILGIRDGRLDAAAGRPAYILSVIVEQRWRREKLTIALRTLSKPLIVAILVDMVLQYFIFRSVRVWHALLIGTTLVALPYVVSRALANRMTRRRRTMRRAA